MEVNLIQIPVITDALGNLAVIEKNALPFPIKRVFYIYDIPNNVIRGGHAHKKLLQVLIAISGSFEVVLKDGKQVKRVVLDKPDKGLLINNYVWEDLENFSPGAVCMVLASDEYDEDDYIRNFDDFLSSIK